MLVHQLTNARKALDLASNFPGVEFAYAVFKNKQIIDNKLMDVDFIKNVSPQVVEYEEKRVALCEECSDKDENGKPIVEGELYKISDKEIFREKIETLLNEYRPFVEERQKQVEVFNHMMNSPVDLPFIKVTKEQLPPQVKTAKDMEELAFMIE